jgi:hypothetical protein
MLVMRTTEDPADPICELISTEQPLGLCDLAFAMNPLGLYGIEPRALGRQQAGHYPHPSFATTVFDSAAVGGDPASHPMAFVPGGIVPDRKQGLLAPLPKPVAAPREKLRGYGAHRPTIHEPQPRLCELWQINPVAGEHLRLGIVLARLLLDEAYRLSGISPRMHTEGRSKRENQLSSSKPRAHSGWPSASRISRSRSPFFGHTPNRGSPSSIWPSASAPPASRASPGWSGH